MHETPASEGPDAIVNYLIKAVEHRDFSAISRVYADDIEIWYNTTNAITRGKEAGIANLKMLESLKSYSVRIIERHVVGVNVIQRHILEITKSDGAYLEVPVAAFLTVEGGKITKLYEYMDPTPLYALSVSKTA